MSYVLLLLFRSPLPALLYITAELRTCKCKCSICTGGKCKSYAQELINSEKREDIYIYLKNKFKINKNKKE